MNEADTIEEKNRQPVSVKPQYAAVFTYKWWVEWFGLLTCVFLFAGFLNFLFQWLSYGKQWNFAGFIFNLALSLLVYFTSLSKRKLASYQARLFISLITLTLWFALLPVLMKFFGFK
ncbi:MAG: hypothetical protein ACQETH_02320 [Candidatus Rifleibacteriota bacterium]